jgi:superfamily I DNA/RNA helicase
MSHTPTPEQEAIISAAVSTTDNLLVSALAGAAKTSTLVMLANALAESQPRLEILCLAFNKKIALEMQERLPPSCSAMTLNSLGYRTWAAQLGRSRLAVDFKKGFNIMQEVIEEQARADKDALYPQMGELMRVVQFGKACGYIPSGPFDGRCKPLMDDTEFFAHIEQKLSPLEESVVRECSIRSIRQALKGVCDFDDQILMPTVFGGAFPLYKLTLVDEAQDLSALNHAMLRKICGTRRLIAVGDQCQAIYGFRGAHEDGMEELKKKFSMKELRLTTSFRCGRKIVEAALWRAPLMRAPDWAVEGEVTSLARWTAADLAEDAAIICRNNAPLFRLAIKLLKAGRPAELGGKDVVQMILKIMAKFGDSRAPQQEVFDKIEAWQAKEIDRTKPYAHGGIRDRAECMRVFAEQGTTLGDALHYARHIGDLHSPLKLLTGHKSKGLEFDTVYFLDENLIGTEKQEPNLRYVIITRAKNTLTYIQSDAYSE